MQFSFFIPDHALVVPAKGSTIDIGDPLFTISQTTSISVNISTELSIKSDDIFLYVTKTIGDTVQKGEVIAQKKKLVGSKQIQSPETGVLEGIDHTTGDIRIRVSEEQNLLQTNSQTPSFFKGKITDIDIKKHILTIDLAQAEDINVKTIPSTFGGPLYFFSDESLFYTATEKDISGNVIVIADLKNHIAAKFETLGAAGFIYLHGQDPTDVPDVVMSKTEFDRLVNAKKKYILFSTREKKVVIYENR